MQRMTPEADEAYCSARNCVTISCRGVVAKKSRVKMTGVQMACILSQKDVDIRCVTLLHRDA